MSERTTTLYLSYNERLKPWRTETVTLLCKQMRETSDYSACPVLADALQEADCDHQELLDELRNNNNDTNRERLIAVIFSEESLKSVLWMTTFCQNTRVDGGDDFMAIIEPVYYDEVMSDIHKVIEGKISESVFISQYENAILLVDRGEFWTHVESITGRKVKVAFINTEWPYRYEEDDDYFACGDC